MKAFLWIVGLMLIGLTGFAGGIQPDIFFCDFNTPESVKLWSPRKMIYRADGGVGNSGCVEFQSTDMASDLLSSVVLDAKGMAGRDVILEGWIKAENLSRPKISYLGPKLMLTVVSEIERNHPDQPKKYGTYDWQKFSVLARIPGSVTQVTLSIGMQGCTGKVWIDDVRVYAEPLPEQDLKPLVGQLPAQKRTLRRGVMSGNDLSEEAFRELRDVWHANLYRFQIGRPNGWDNTTADGYRKIIDHNLKKLDQVLPLAKKYGLQVVIDMHVGPGTKVDGLLSNQLSYEPKMQQLLIDTWREIAQKYRGNSTIYGYDLLNEPREEGYVPGQGAMKWRELGEAIALAIREEDPDTPIIFEAAPWGGPIALDGFVPINVPKVIYSIHYYRPGTYTHQGVTQDRPIGVNYPGMIDGEYFDKDRLEKGLQAAIDFQKKYNVPIYVGEFGVIRWAPNGEQWLDDMISIFEKYGWDWTLHAFREWDGWDVEVGPDPADRTRIKDTPRREVLLRYMKRNLDLK